MSDPGSETHGSVATAEPPAKPPAPPTTGVAAPKPAGGKPGRGCWLIGLVVVGVVAIALGLFLWWALSRPSASATNPAAASAAFDSAMTKAMVKSPGEPPSPVELTSIKARGTHSFEATFTGEELAALVNAFPHGVTISNTPVALSNVAIDVTPEGGMTLSGTVTSGSSAYSGQVTGPVAFKNSQVVATGSLSVEAEGFPVPDAQAKPAIEILLAYVNGYLSAAPGLTVTAASVSPKGVHVAGLAPDSISY